MKKHLFISLVSFLLAMGLQAEQTVTVQGKVWLKCSYGAKDDANCSTNPTRMAYSYTKANCPSGFRVPTFDELSSLLVCSEGKDTNGGCKAGSVGPFIDTKLFPGVSQPTAHWTEAVKQSNYTYRAKAVNFYDGKIEDRDTSNNTTLLLRCIKQ